MNTVIHPRTCPACGAMRLPMLPVCLTCLGSLPGTLLEDLDRLVVASDTNAKHPSLRRAWDRAVAIAAEVRHKRAPTHYRRRGSA